MKKCCEYCYFYEQPYELKCKDCRVDEGIVDYSEFELNDELKELGREALLGKAVMYAIRNGYSQQLLYKFTDERTPVIIIDNHVIDLVDWYIDRVEGEK